MIKRTWTGILLLGLLLMGYGEVVAQEEVVKWPHYDASAIAQQNSTVLVEEISEEDQQALRPYFPSNSLRTPYEIVQNISPRWQQQEGDSSEPWARSLGWRSVLLGLLYVLLGPWLVFGWWYLRIRVSSGSSIPNYIESPPSNLTPAVAGALLDGKAGPRHIMATLLDMAYRGIFNIDSTHEDSALPDDKIEPTFNFYAVAQNKIAKPYEVILYSQIFGDAQGNKRQLCEIHQALFLFAPELKNRIDSEIAKAGYYSTKVGSIRRLYVAFGGVGIIMSLGLALLLAVFLREYTYLVACPFLGITVGFVALVVAGFATPKRSEAGAKEVAWLEAFKRYLKNMNKSDVTKNRQRFAQLLPYAVSFGLEKNFVEKFAAVDTPIPEWWGKPKEQLPGISHDRARAWMGSTDTLQSPDPQPKSEKTRTRSAIRRLNQPAENYPSQPATRQPKLERTRTKSAIRRLNQPAENYSSQSATRLPKSKRTRTNSVIQRLNQPPENAPPDTLLKHIRPTFQAFLKAGKEVFCKAPLLDPDEEISFASLE